MSQPPNTRSSSEASGTTSLIFGDRPSVRLPRRTVPICVSDPIGFAIFFRIAHTPAIVVVLTAPRPTKSTPSLPRAGAISTGVGMRLQTIYQRDGSALRLARFQHVDQPPRFALRRSAVALAKGGRVSSLRTGGQRGATRGTLCAFSHCDGTLTRKASRRSPPMLLVQMK